MDPSWFAGRLRELREAAGWTQQQLAGRAGLTREGVAQLETGRREPALATLITLCKALNVSADAILAKPTTPTEARPKGRPLKAGRRAGGQPEPEPGGPTRVKADGEKPRKGKAKGAKIPKSA